ncbi:MAG TPA: DnaJ domain-containing protein [Chitinophagales bacterium]|nr:DnaJ domain-containing protein [Chitinophagales bacterium]
MAKFSFNSLLNSVSKLMSEDEVVEKKLNPQQKAHQQEIENSILVLAADVIRCDRNFSDATEKFVQQFLAKQFGAVNSKHRSSAVANHIDIGTEPFTKIACKQLKLLTTHDSRLHILSFLFGVAAADDFVNAKELRALTRMAGYLGISDKDFKQIKQTALAGNNPYFALGLEETATIEEVKIAYRKMVLKYHPDKRTDGVSEEEANHKFRDIKRAFELIKQQHKKGD